MVFVFENVAFPKIPPQGERSEAQTLMAEGYSIRSILPNPMGLQRQLRREIPFSPAPDLIARKYKLKKRSLDHALKCQSGKLIGAAGKLIVFYIVGKP